jgi:hypothetical protein
MNTGLRCTGMLRSACWLVVVYRRFVTGCWISLPFTIVPIDCLETSVARNKPLGAKTMYTPQRNHKISQVLIHFVNIDFHVKRGSEELNKMLPSFLTVQPGTAFSLTGLVHYGFYGYLFHI